MEHISATQDAACKLLKALANLEEVTAALDESIDLQKDAAFLSVDRILSHIESN